MRYNKTWQGASQVEIQLDLLKNKWARCKKVLRLLLHYNIGPRLSSLKLGSDHFLYRILLSQWKWNDCAMVLVETIRWWKWTVKLKILWQLKENIREIKNWHTILWASATPQATWGFTIFGRANLASTRLCSKSSS